MSCATAATIRALEPQAEWHTLPASNWAVAACSMAGPRHALLVLLRCYCSDMAQHLAATNQQVRVLGVHLDDVDEAVVGPWRVCSCLLRGICGQS